MRSTDREQPVWTYQLELRSANRRGRTASILRKASTPTLSVAGKIQASWRLSCGSSVPSWASEWGMPSAILPSFENALKFSGRSGPKGSQTSSRTKILASPGR